MRRETRPLVRESFRSNRRCFQEMVEWGEDFAARQATLIWDTAELLGEFPFMGATVPDLDQQTDLNERRLFVPGTRYFIYYRVEEDVVHVAAIVYAPLIDLPTR